MHAVWSHTAIMLAAGIGIPILAALNAQLGTRLGAAPAAALVLFCVATLCALAVVLLTGSAKALSTLPLQPRHLLLAGVLVVFYVLSVTWIAPRFGVGNAIFCVLLGQLISAAVIDQLGLFGARQIELSLPRALGLVLMAAGLTLTRLG